MTEEQIKEAIKLLNKAKNSLIHARKWIINLNPNFDDNGVYRRVCEQIDEFLVNFESENKQDQKHE